MDLELEVEVELEEGVLEVLVDVDERELLMVVSSGYSV